MTDKKAAKEAVPADESKEARFKRVAERRVNKAIGALRVLRGVSDPDRYEYTDAQAGKIAGAITAEAQRTAEAIVGREKEGHASFKL